MAIDSDSLPGSPFIESGIRMFYSIGISPVSNGINIADVIDWSQNVESLRYSGKGNLIDSFKVVANTADFFIPVN